MAISSHPNLDAIINKTIAASGRDPFSIRRAGEYDETVLAVVWGCPIFKYHHSAKVAVDGGRKLRVTSEGSGGVLSLEILDFEDWKPN